jgi:YceI-like domain
MLDRVPIQAGSYRLGPDNATLSVHTERAGAAAKAGHDLLLHVTAWEATLRAADDPAATSMELAADGTSLRVVEGTGGMQALEDDDIASIHQTIDDEVLGREDIRFRSTGTRLDPDGATVHVDGELTLVGATHPISFDLVVADGGKLSATAVVKQSAWGVKPYSALFGALKVKDEVRVELRGQLGSQSR